MEYQKIINFLDNTPSQPAKFKTKNWIEINDESRGTYNEDNQIRFKTSALRWSLRDYRDSYILVKGTITVEKKAVLGQATNNANKKVIFKNYAPFTNCISRINNTEVDDAHDIDVVMPMYNLIEYSNNYSKTSGILWQYCRDELALAVNGDINEFNAANATNNLFKIKEKVTGKTGSNGTKNVELMVPLKYLTNFWRTLEMSFINCQINLNLNWSKNWVIMATDVADQGSTFSKTDTKLYVPVVNLSNQNNAKLLEKLKFGFKRTINWNKYQSKISTERWNQCLDYFITLFIQFFKE